MTKQLKHILMCLALIATPLVYGDDGTRPEIIASGGVIENIDAKAGTLIISDRIYHTTPYTEIEAAGFKNAIITQLKKGDSVSLKYYRHDSVDYIQSIKVVGKNAPPIPSLR